ncbi:hypothetical protein ACFL21_01740 [Patescibacteria group bacterium]
MKFEERKDREDLPKKDKKEETLKQRGDTLKGFTRKKKHMMSQVSELITDKQAEVRDKLVEKKMFVKRKAKLESYREEKPQYAEIVDLIKDETVKDFWESKIDSFFVLLGDISPDEIVDVKYLLKWQLESGEGSQMKLLETLIRSGKFKNSSDIISTLVERNLDKENKLVLLGLTMLNILTNEELKEFQLSVDESGLRNVMKHMDQEQIYRTFKHFNLEEITKIAILINRKEKFLRRHIIQGNADEIKKILQKYPDYEGLVS